MALAGTAPMIWGLATGKLNDAVWIAVTAEGISWVEMKGSFNWRVRTLFIGALLAMFWGALGTFTGFSIWLSVLCMFVAGFVATLLKNLGDRASGLAICVYLLFIICNAYPDKDVADVWHRMMLIARGAGWAGLVGLSASIIMPVQQPFRRQIALIWRSVSGLVDTITRSAVNKQARTDIFLKEKDVRTAIDNSFSFYGRMAHQANKQDNRQYQLLLLRKNAALVAVNVIAIADEMEHIDVPGLDEELRVKAATLFSAMKEAVSRMSVYVITLKKEEKLLVNSQINRIKKLSQLISRYPLQQGTRQTAAIHRIIQITGRVVKLLESALQRLEAMGEDIPVFRSYSLMKTMFVLRPGKIYRNIRDLSNFNTLAIRFAFRSAIAAAIGLFIAKWLAQPVFTWLPPVTHGYWIPFSLMIVIQPYFGATLEKARDRVLGTVLGGIAGGILALIPTGLHLKEAMLFATFMLMVYYVRKNYAIAVFTVTLNLVLVFNIDSSYSDLLLVERTLCTIGGALLAVVSGFALLPAWDKKWLPHHLADAIHAGYDYFVLTFLDRSPNWTKNKRLVESRNSDVFDSFNRYMHEPGREKNEEYYDLITANVRITRDLNTINLEQDEKMVTDATPHPAQQKLFLECLELYHTVLEHTRSLKPGKLEKRAVITSDTHFPFQLNEVQMVSLEKMKIELKALIEDLSALSA
jgi:uncharacterized membrane protein YccC